MIKELLSQDAFINYFSEFLGILVTVILIPIILHLYFKKRNKSKEYLAEKILMEKLNNTLDKIVPIEFRDYDSGTIWLDKKAKKQRIIVYSHILPFSLKNNSRDNIENYFINKYNSYKIEKFKKLKKIHFILNKFSIEINNFLTMYGDVVKKDIIKEYYKLDFNIQTTNTKFIKYKEFDNEIYAETISIVINGIDRIRKIVLSKHIEAEKDYFYETFKTPTHNSK